MSHSASFWGPEAILRAPSDSPSPQHLPTPQPEYLRLHQPIWPCPQRKVCQSVKEEEEGVGRQFFSHRWKEVEETMETSLGKLEGRGGEGSWLSFLLSPPLIQWLPSGSFSTPPSNRFLLENKKAQRNISHLPAVICHGGATVLC